MSEVFLDSAEFSHYANANPGVPRRSPYGEPGARLWVRETWQAAVRRPSGLPSNVEAGMVGVEYAADRTFIPHERAREYWPAKTDWRPSIFMPRWACRLMLEVLEVRVERVKDIKDEDILAEGIDLPQNNGCSPTNFPPEFKKWGKKRQEEWIEGQARATYFAQCADVDDHFTAFEKLWDSINAKRGYAWEKNPWVWVVTFKRMER